jgi:hypothetical protein
MSEAASQGQGARKNIRAEILCNPLISLDSDERIQGNPRESNTLKPSFRNETAGFQENPKRTREAARREVTRTSPS